MIDSAWELIVDRCHHCGEWISIHHRSTISERHLMEMIFQDLNHHRINKCDKEANFKKMSQFEIELEKKSDSSSTYLYKYENRNLLF